MSTRGGLATTLNEMAKQSQVGIKIDEVSLPVNKAVASACELLGFDPLYIANEGKLVAIVPPPDANKVLDRMKQSRYGQEAAIIGEVVDKHQGRVVMKTSFYSILLTHQNHLTEP